MMLLNDQWASLRYVLFAREISETSVLFSEKLLSINGDKLVTYVFHNTTSSTITDYRKSVLDIAFSNT
jgi:adenosylmethionine-8-amino-7-oxononanoate aminotransferase